MNRLAVISGFLALSLIVLTGCHRVKPQGAANKTEADSTALKLMEMNLLLALDADEQITDSVKASGVSFVLLPLNIWYYRMQETDGREVKDKMRVEYSAVIRDLSNGKLLEEVTEEVEVGSRTALRAIDCCFPYMREGETFLILAPYYNAFGRDGNEFVAPLTNVKIELKINNITKI